MTFRQAFVLTYMVIASVARGNDQRADYASQAQHTDPASPEAAAPAPNEPSKNSIELVYGNGTQLDITWRGVDWNDYPERPFGPQYDELLDLASKGDREAAYKLFRILESCSSAFDSEQERNEAINLAQTNSALVMPGQPPIPIASIRSSEPIDIDDRLQRHIEAIQSSYEACKPITEEQESERHRWLEEAADGGPVEAIIYYASGLDDNALVAEYYERAWSMGSLSALRYLADTYLSLYESGAVPDNNVTAYATIYAYLTIGEQATNHFTGKSITAYKESYEYQQKILRRFESSLGPTQSQQAVDQAIQMIQSNANCCYTN